MPWASLKSELRQCPGMVGLLFDSELKTLLSPPPLDPGLAAPLMGEAMVRYWLYEDPDSRAAWHALLAHCSGEVGRAIRKLKQGKSRPRIKWQEIPPGIQSGHPIEKRAWEWMVGRTRAFGKADGVIAVARPPDFDEAIAIPFRVSPAETRRGGIILDQKGHEAGHWNAELSRINHLFPAGVPRVILGCDCGPRVSRLEGGSLVLAILAAIWRRNGELGDYDSLDVLCTGSFNA